MVDFVFAAPNNVTTFAEKLAYIDGLTNIGYGGMLGPGMMLVIFFCLTFMMKAFRFETAIAPAAFITAFLGILIRVLLPLSDSIIYISIIFCVIGLLFLKNHSGQQEI